MVLRVADLPETVTWLHKPAMFAAALALAFPAAARTVVLQSTGPSAGQFPPGRVLAEPLLIKLKRGDRVKVLDAQGTRDLTGPRAIDDRKRRNLSVRRLPTWEALTGGTIVARAAATRDVGRAASPGPTQPLTEQDQLWAIDPSVGGSWCAPAGGLFGLWRRDTSGELGVTVTADEETASVIFAAGQSVARWPTFRAAHQRYRFGLSSGEVHEATLHHLEIAGSASDLAADLTKRGCFQQLSILLAE